jgi:hypothetical protein
VLFEEHRKRRFAGAQNDSPSHVVEELKIGDPPLS